MNPVSCIGYIKLIAMYLYIFITLLPQSSLPPSPLPPMPYNEHLYHNIQMYYCRSGNRNWYPMYPSSLYSMNPGHHHPKMKTKVFDNGAAFARVRSLDRKKVV